MSVPGGGEHERRPPNSIKGKIVARLRNAQRTGIPGFNGLNPHITILVEVHVIDALWAALIVLVAGSFHAFHYGFTNLVVQFFRR